jgi:hypothetical protein
MKTYGGVDVVIHVFLTSALVGCGQFHAPTALSPWKSTRYPSDRRLGGPQSRFGRRGEEKILDPTGTRTPSASESAVTVPDGVVTFPTKTFFSHPFEFQTKELCLS